MQQKMLRAHAFIDDSPSLKHGQILQSMVHASGYSLPRQACQYLWGQYITMCASACHQVVQDIGVKHQLEAVNRCILQERKDASSLPSRSQNTDRIQGQHYSHDQQQQRGFMKGDHCAKWC
jgi:hypothetical protein